MTPHEQFTVQMVPSGHPYCHHVLPPDRSPQFSPRPDPPVPGAPAGQWWPPRALDAEWLRGHVPDVLHVHFGFESFAPEQLRQVAQVLRDVGSALVVTVHDLHNPHFRDRARHLEQLDVLVPAADEVLTLTEQAAAEILGRWGRAATVVPHPHIVPLDRIPAGPPAHWSSGSGTVEADGSAGAIPGAAARADVGPDAGTGTTAVVGAETPPADRHVVIGIHAKDLRANVDPFSALDGAALAVRTLRERGVVARVRVDVREDPQDIRALGRLRIECTRHGFDLWEHGRLSDDELYADLRSLDATVLPYAFGTHSGWLEMCRDLGVPVAVPQIGCFAGQATSPALQTFAPGDDAALAEALLTLLEGRDHILPADPGQRRAQREAVAAEHERVYARSLATARARAGVRVVLGTGVRVLAGVRPVLRADGVSADQSDGLPAVRTADVTSKPAVGVTTQAAAGVTTQAAVGATTQTSTRPVAGATSQAAAQSVVSLKPVRPVSRRAGRPTTIVSRPPGDIRPPESTRPPEPVGTP